MKLVKAFLQLAQFRQSLGNSETNPESGDTEADLVQALAAMHIMRKTMAPQNFVCDVENRNVTGVVYQAHACHHHGSEKPKSSSILRLGQRGLPSDSNHHRSRRGQ